MVNFIKVFRFELFYHLNNFRLFAILSITLSSSFYVKYVNLEKEDVKKWEANSNLKWFDFKGEVDTASHFKALTSSYINFEITEKYNFINIDLSTFFNRNKSWTKDKTSKVLLSHEQLHFDITELVARKIRKECSSIKLSKLSFSKIVDTLSEIYNKYYFNDLKDLQYYYDKQTDHSIIIEKQLEWEQKIAKELKVLNKYSNPIISRGVL